MKTREAQAIGGSSGMGKTNYMIWDFLRKADAGDCGLAGHFAHEDAGEELLLQLERRFHLNRVVVFDTKTTRKVLAKRFVGISTLPPGFDRDAENEEFALHLLALAARLRKDIKDLRERSSIRRNALLAIRVYQELDFSGLWLPPFEIPQILEKDSHVQRWAIRNCRHLRLRHELEQVRELNGHDQIAKVLPAQSFLADFLCTELMRAMLSVRPTFDLAAHLKACAATGEPGIYIALGGCTSDAITLHFGSDFKQIEQDAKSNPSEVNRFIYQDEIFNYGLFREDENRALATLRGFRVHWRGAFQTYPVDESNVVRGLRGNTDKVIFGTHDFDQALDFAKDLVKAADEYKVHHTKTTTKQRTHHRKEERVTRGKHTDADGKIGMSENVSVTLVPEIEEYVEETPEYQSPNDQLFWFAQRLMELPVGHAWFQIGTGKPYRGIVPEVFPVCGSDDERREEADRCMAELMESPLYQTPKEFLMPPQPEMPKPAKPAKPAEKPRAAAPRIRGRKPTGS